MFTVLGARYFSAGHVYAVKREREGGGEREGEGGYQGKKWSSHARWSQVSQVLSLKTIVLKKFRPTKRNWPISFTLFQIKFSSGGQLFAISIIVLTSKFANGNSIRIKVEIETDRSRANAIK
jgi:hypothetical protein